MNFQEIRTDTLGLVILAVICALLLTGWGNHVSDFAEKIFQGMHAIKG